MSSGGSSGFPSTPAPTPFTAHPGGVRPEELAAGISRLSVIEESGETHKMASNEQPNLSSYFGTPTATASTSIVTSNVSSNKKIPEDKKDEEFFDNFSNKNSDAVMQSCRESRVDLSNMDPKKKASNHPITEAEIAVSVQEHKEEFKPCKPFAEAENENLEIAKRPTSLPKGTTPILTNTEATPLATPSNPSSSYATPIGKRICIMYLFKWSLSFKKANCKIYNFDPMKVVVFMQFYLSTHDFLAGFLE